MRNNRSRRLCLMEVGKGGRYQSAPLSMVSVQAAPRAAKSAERMEGAMIAGGDISSGGGCVEDECQELSHC